MNKRARNLIFIGSIVIIIAAITTYYAAKKIYQGTKINIVTLRLNWIPDPTFTGPYVAKYNGFWSKKGLDVDIKVGGYQINPISLVASGENDFGIAGADRVLYAVANKIPIKAIAVDFKQNPVGWVVREESNIKTPKDFEGHKIGFKYGEESEFIFYALMKKYSVNIDKIERIPVEYSLNPFFMKIVEAFPVYMNEEPHRIRDKGIKIRIINPAEYGIQIYGNVVFTSDKLIKTNPELIRRFLEGYIDGWEFARNNPGISAKLLKENVKEMDQATIERVLNSTLELLDEKAGERKSKIGSMNKEGWEKIKEMLVNYGELNKDINVEDAFDMSFIEKIIEKK